MADEADKPRRFVSIEDVVAALAGQCDGARRRDGRGFNRADAQEGGRLAALKNNDLPWSVKDARRAKELTTRYAAQAGLTLGRGVDKRADGIEKACREGRIQLNEPTSERQPAYNYACLSPGGKRAYFWRLAAIPDFHAFHAALVALTRLSHGERRTRFDRTQNAEITLNGEKQKRDRYEIDMHGAAWGGIIQTAKRHGFLIEPALAAGPDSEIDMLRMAGRSAWVHRGTRNGLTGLWAVFDLAAKFEPFSSEVKIRLRGRFVCDPSDDWNWFVAIAPDTADAIRGLIRRHGFSASAELDALTAPVVEGSLSHRVRDARMALVR